MTEATKRASAAYRKREAEKVKAMRRALEIISADPPNHPWAKMAAQVAKQALFPKSDMKEKE